MDACTHSDTAEHAPAPRARERILVLDGAMGTMIQAHKFSEADFRGDALRGLAARSARQQ